MTKPGKSRARPGSEPAAPNPIRGRRPLMQDCPLAELTIDPAYQRSVTAKASRALINAIARDWDWRLYQPLIVARRDDALFVIDGQHRLEAARLRGDLPDLPCVIIASDGPADEAALFKGLNGKRRALGALDLFRAGVAEGGEEERVIADVLAQAGLRLAPHTNPTAWEAGMVANVSGLRRAIREHGRQAATRAASVLALAWQGQILRYFGTVFPGVAQFFATVPDASDDLVAMLLEGNGQMEWATEIGSIAAERHCHQRDAAALAIRAAWDEAMGDDEDELEAAA